MMKRILTLTLFTLLFIPSWSQECIVLKNGDTIRVKNLHETDSNFYYKVKYNGCWVTTYTDTSGVSFYTPVKKTFREKLKSNPIVPAYRTGLKIGYSYILTPLNQNVPVQYKKDAASIKKGLDLQFDLYKVSTDLASFGFLADFQSSSVNIENNTENLDYLHIAPSVMISPDTLRGTIAYLSVSPGFSIIEDNVQENGNNLSLRSMGIGVLFSTGLEIPFSKNNALNLEISYKMSQFSKLKAGAAVIDHNGPINLSAFIIKAGIRMY